MKAASLLALLLAALAPSLSARQGTPGSGADHWGADYFPNVELTSHEGKHLRFFDDLVKDKVVLINFIYTSCPDSCPLETARLAEVQDVLGERVGRDIFMYSISIDPAHDTPEVLAQYAERFQTKPGWLFLTGKEADIALLRQKLGLLGSDDKELKSHNLSLIVGNQATGRWMRRSPFENAFVLANQLGDWLHDWKAPRPAGQGYADAPKLRTISRGESLFRTRCSACHAVGAGDGLARIGPNLAGVLQRRERTWLERWIAAPDQMLADRDPLASELFAAYNRVPMPNLRLNEIEISALLDFVDEESRSALSPDTSAAAETLAAARGCCQKQEHLVLAAEDALPAATEQVVEAPPAEGGRSCCLKKGSTVIPAGAPAPAQAQPTAASSHAPRELFPIGVGLAAVFATLAIRRRLRT